MPRKRKSKCLFVDNEAAEEDDEGNIVHNSGDEEEDEDHYESDFVDDSEDVIVRREKVKLDADEYEIDEDDWLLLQDNARANRVSRITRAESSSDSDSFIDDDGASVVVPFENVAVDPPEELFYDEEDVLNTLIELSKESESPEEAKQPVVSEPSPPASPLPISMYVSLEENTKRISGPSWADFKFNQPPQNARKKSTPTSNTKKRTPPSKAPPKLEPGIIRTSDGMFLVTGSGKRIRMTEEGSVKL